MAAPAAPEWEYDFSTEEGGDYKSEVVRYLGDLMDQKAPEPSPQLPPPSTPEPSPQLPPPPPRGALSATLVLVCLSL